MGNVVCGKRREEERVVAYKNRGEIEEFMGDTQPYLVEVLAVRIFLLLQGNRWTTNEKGNITRIDWTYESCPVTWLRDCGPALRASLLLVGIYMLILEFFFDLRIFFNHEVHIDGWSMIPANITVNTALVLWVFDIGMTCLGFCYLNAGRGDLRLTVYSTKAELRKRLDPLYCMRVIGTIAWLVYAVLFFAIFVLCAFVMHTVFAQVYFRQNYYFAALLGVLTLTSVLTGLADIVSVGSPWGIGESSRDASALLSFRAIVVVPLVTWFTICSVFASWPPSFCEEC